MVSAREAVWINLSSTLIKLLRLVEVLLYAVVHQLGHLVTRTLIFLRGASLPIISFSLEKLIRYARSPWGLHLAGHACCHVLLVTDHRALFGDALWGIVK